MIIETIKNYVHNVRDKIVTLQYATLVDNQNKRYLQITEYSFTPYSVSGKLETQHTKGVHFDKKV